MRSVWWLNFVCSFQQRFFFHSYFDCTAHDICLLMQIFMLLHIFIARYIRCHNVIRAARYPRVHHLRRTDVSLHDKWQTFNHIYCVSPRSNKAMEMVISDFKPHTLWSHTILWWHTDASYYLCRCDNEILKAPKLLYYVACCCRWWANEWVQRTESKSERKKEHPIPECHTPEACWKSVCRMWLRTEGNCLPTCATSTDFQHAFGTIDAHDKQIMVKIDKHRQHAAYIHILSWT